MIIVCSFGQKKGGLNELPGSPFVPDENRRHLHNVPRQSYRTTHSPTAKKAGQKERRLEAIHERANPPNLVKERKTREKRRFRSHHHVCNTRQRFLFFLTFINYGVGSLLRRVRFLIFIFQFRECLYVSEFSGVSKEKNESNFCRVAETGKMKRATKEEEKYRFSFFLFLFRRFVESEEGNPSDRKVE